jgi:hypothetical protein
MTPTDADMDLRALAGIQAIEAAPLTAAFRQQWLDGSVLPDDEAAYEWLRRHGTPAQDEALLRFVGTGPSMPRRPGDAMSDWVRQHAESASVAFVQKVKPWLSIDVHDAEGQIITRLDLAADAGTPMGELLDVATVLENRYRWSTQDGAIFVLTGCYPVPQVVHASWDQERTFGSVWHTTAASVPMTQEIVLRCRPQATQQQVAKAYEEARREALERWHVPVGQRNRATSSDRTRALAVLAARIRAGEFASTREAMEAYLREREDEQGDKAGYYVEYRRDEIGRFRRDVRIAWKRITGLEFGFDQVFRKEGSRGDKAGRAGGAKV